MKVFITGERGFIGSVLAQKCEEAGFEIVKSSKDVFYITQEDLMGVDCVFHLAAKTNITYTIEHPEETTRINVSGTVHLLRCAVKAGVKRFVFSSTASVYGRNKTPWKEDMPVDPMEPYSFQKAACEEALKAWNSCYGIQTISLRLFQVFGEDNRSDLVLAHFAELKRQGEPLTVSYTKDGGYAERDFVYVDDVADAFIKSAQSEKLKGGEIINIASGKPTSLYDVARAFGGEIEHVLPRKFEVLKHKANVRKAKEALGWSTETTIINWIKGYV